MARLHNTAGTVPFTFSANSTYSNEHVAGSIPARQEGEGEHQQHHHHHHHPALIQLDLHVSQEFPLEKKLPLL